MPETAIEDTRVLEDEELLRRFENADFSPGEFHHTEHVRVAWLYLRDKEPTEALGLFARGLRSLADRLGATGLYHETITWSYVLLIAERMNGEADWESFARSNPELLDWQDSILGRYYSDELLWSDRARERFVFPDRVPTDP